MKNEMTTTVSLPEAVEKALMLGDLSSLTVEQRISYYNKVCESTGLNAFTNPLAFIVLNGKLTLYAKKEATDQLRNLRKLSIQIVSREKMGDLYIVTARAIGHFGRYDESTGVVHIARLQGDALANAMMKAETKAKRRVTLSYSGLSLLDESEIDTIKGVQKVDVDYTPPVLIGDTPTLVPVEIPKPVVPVEIPKPEMYDQDNTKHIVRLESILREMKVPETDWGIVSENLHGKEMTPKTVKEICKKVFEGNEGNEQ